MAPCCSRATSTSCVGETARRRQRARRPARRGAGRRRSARGGDAGDPDPGVVQVLLVGRADGAVGHHARRSTWKFLPTRTRRCCWRGWCARWGRSAAALGIGLSDRGHPAHGQHLLGQRGRGGGDRHGAPGRSTGATRPAHRMSALQDIEAGRPLEVNETLGYACDKARERSAATCRCSTCFRRLIAATDRRARCRGRRLRLAAGQPAILQQRRDLGCTAVEVAEQHLRVLAAAPRQHLVAQQARRWRASGRRAGGTTAPVSRASTSLHR